MIAFEPTAVNDYTSTLYCQRQHFGSTPATVEYSTDAFHKKEQIFNFDIENKLHTEDST